jgi:hypothetical protein
MFSSTVQSAALSEKYKYLFWGQALLNFLKIVSKRFTICIITFVLNIITIEQPCAMTTEEYLDWQDRVKW